MQRYPPDSPPDRFRRLEAALWAAKPTTVEGRETAAAQAFAEENVYPALEYIAKEVDITAVYASKVADALAELAGLVLRRGRLYLPTLRDVSHIDWDATAGPQLVTPEDLGLLPAEGGAEEAS